MKASQGRNAMLRQCLMAVFGLMIVGLSATVSFAADPVPPTCDPKYWDSLKARAWTEAQREIEQNQNLIYKADSVLEYTCFDKYLQALTNNAPNMFSESTRWGSVSGPDMGAALNNLVANSLANYKKNFAHNFLGDRSSWKYSYGAATGGSATYDCDTMLKVWQAAKCQDFANKGESSGTDPVFSAFKKKNTSAQDDFFPMDYYKTPSNDVRKLPLACTGATDFAAKYSIAQNDANQYPKEAYKSYADFYSSTSCAAPKIPTGIQVIRTGSTTPYAEIICVNPGCASDATGGSCTQTPQ